MKDNSKIVIVVAIFISIWALSSCVQNPIVIDDYDLYSSFEERSEDNKFFKDSINNTFLIVGGNNQNNLFSKSGNYSVLTTPKSKYSLSTEFVGVKKDSYVTASVWRKGNNGHLVATITGYQGYISTKDPIEVNSNGWEKLFLEFHIPPISDYPTLKFYVWNSGSDSVYFDDYQIIIKDHETLPVYNEEAFHIELDTSDYLALMNVRKRAFKNGILQSQDDDWVKGFVFSDNKLMKTNLRLKGDWLDHLHGNKWSFRIKLKQDNVWKNMRVFSVQNPMARLGVNEWFLHKLLISEDVLTTRYGFMPITINGDNLGLYAWEEHFAKQLVESQNRREGPILKLVESALWDTRVYGDDGKRYLYDTPIFDVATIKPFSTNKIVENPIMYNQFLIAQNLMYQYKNRLKSASEIFNIIILAKYFAIADVFLGRHSVIWHNQRFYYNPVLCKLEPISYDCYSDIGLSMSGTRPIFGFIKNNAIGTLNDEYLLSRELFNDTAFTALYISYLDKYSSEHYLDSVFNSYAEGINYYDSLIKIEFPDQHFFKNEILENATKIRETLPDFKKQYLEMKKENKKWKNISKKDVKYDTIVESFTAPNTVLCYQEKSYSDSLIFKVNNFHPEKIIIMGLGVNNKRFNQVVFPIPMLEGSRNGIPSTTEFTMDSTEFNYLFFTIEGNSEILTTEIMPWEEPSGKNTPLQQLIASYPFPDYKLIDRIENQNIIIKSGKVNISNPVIIPSGFNVVFNKGTSIDFTDSACFISYSPVTMAGTKDEPISVGSSDFTGNGFTVLQAGGISTVSNTIFKNLNTLNYKGWVLTGAVNFYESDVHITNATFFRNQCEDALNIIRSKFTLSNSLFDYIFADAFDSDFSQGEVLSTTFTNIGNDAIDFSGSQILINNVEISNASDKGISGGENSQLIVKNTNITHSNIGLSSKDLSTVEVINSSVSDCNYGIVLLQKKPEYGPSTMILNNSTINKSKNRYLIEAGSVVIENNDTIQGTEKNVAAIFY